MLISVVLYGFIIKMVPSTGRRNVMVLRVVVALSVALLATIGHFRRRMVKPAEQILASQPNDPSALRRWRTGYLITYACGEAVALYGVVLHFLGFTLTEVLPFLLAGFVLILFFTPSRPAEAR